MFDSYSHVYLSPHYDDASLSCGGTIHRLAQAGQAVLVVTLCAAPPESGQPLSPFAGAMHQSWGNPAGAVATRQAEDQASLAILGADYVRLNLADCIYRGRPEAGEWYYTSDAAIFGQVHPADTSLAGAIAAGIAELVPAGAETILYAPLSAGHHVDHQLAHAAAWQLRRQGWQVLFYEDYPYVDPAYPFTRPAQPWEAEHDLVTTLARRQSAQLLPQISYFSEEDLRAKIKSVAAYASQLAVLFGGEAAMAARLADYALAVGQGQPAERFWQPRSD